jgi:protein-S-isoprenylcysteine O-methyltransferase Ste14
MVEESGSSVRLLRWCGMALVAAGVLMAVATLLHPSRETASTIIASEMGLVAAHFVYTLAWLLVLLGLPGLYVSPRRDGTAWTDRVPDCLRRYLSDCRRRKLRVLCPGLG